MDSRPDSLPQFDDRTCRRAVETSDPAFDGKFVFGVTSTSIYCRPSCPSRVPKPANTRYFASPALAVAAGFRACKRCHPDAALGAEPRARAAELALALIDDGAIERVGVSGLAARVGYSERQLRRLLHEHYGESALQLAARARRAS